MNYAVGILLSIIKTFFFKTFIVKFYFFTTFYCLRIWVPAHAYCLSSRPASHYEDGHRE